jgi:hypothetical protein
MSIFSGAKNKEELILVFHIGSSAVGGALFSTQASGIPKVIFLVTEPIQIEETLNLDRFLSLTIKSLESVVKKIYEARKGAPARIFCVLASPWHTSQTRIISLKKDTSFIFTTKLADELIQKEIKIFEAEHLAQYSSTENKVRAIELKNIKTLLNGYETVNPVNQKIIELEMIIFISISGEQFLKKIEDTIAQSFHFEQIKFSSSAMASFAVVRDLHPSKDNFLLVEISGEVTDISMIKKDTLRESISFPLGRNFLIRGVALGTQSTIDEASSMISLFKNGHAEESTGKLLAPILEKLGGEWLKKFQESLANFTKDISIPATIYLSTDKENVDFFSSTIKAEQFSQYTLTESKFEIILLDTQLLNGLSTFAEPGIYEPALVVDVVYINRFPNNSATARQI